MRLKLSERMNNHEVLRSWSVSRPAKAGSLWTDGGSLFSVRLQIGYTDEHGKKVLLDYTKESGYFISYKTSHHVGVAKKYAASVIKPHHNKELEATMEHVGNSIAADFIQYKENKRFFRKLAGVE